jgi:RNA polymerase sigma-70 factor (ECF subfamily)
VNASVAVAEDLDHAAVVFLGARPRLFQVAYGTLGSVSDTEDVVQDAWLRWQRTDRATVRNPTSFLATTTSRLALNTVQSARRRHETYTDPQDLESADLETGPEDGAVRGEAVGQAVLLLLQTLSPMERAAYVLREAFDYPYRRIAEILRITPAYTRQLVARAHRGISARARRPVEPAVHSHLVRVFLAASRTGNLSALERLLTADTAGSAVTDRGAARS